MAKSLDGILGLIIADAMSVPAKTRNREKLTEEPITEMVNSTLYKTPAGTWSDESSLTLALMDSINNKKMIDYSDIANNYLKWYKEAKYTSNDKVFDITETEKHAIERIEEGKESAEKCGEHSEISNFHTTLARLLPLAYYLSAGKHSDKEIYKIIKDVTTIINSNEVTILGSYIFVRFAMLLLKGISIKDAYKKIRSYTYDLFFSKRTVIKYNRVLKQDISKYELDQIFSNGYVVNSVETIIWVLISTENYNEAVIGAVNLGENCNDIASCVGGLAGIAYGITTIREAWVNAIMNTATITKYCETFDEVLNEIVVTGGIPDNPDEEGIPKKKREKKTKKIKEDSKLEEDIKEESKEIIDNNEINVTSESAEEVKEEIEEINYEKVEPIEEKKDLEEVNENVEKIETGKEESDVPRKKIKIKEVLNQIDTIKHENKELKKSLDNKQTELDSIKKELDDKFKSVQQENELLKKKIEEFSKFDFDKILEIVNSKKSELEEIIKENELSDKDNVKVNVNKENTEVEEFIEADDSEDDSLSEIEEVKEQESEEAITTDSDDDEEKRVDLFDIAEDIEKLASTKQNSVREINVKKYEAEIDAINDEIEKIQNQIDRIEDEGNKTKYLKMINSLKEELEVLYEKKENLNFDVDLDDEIIIEDNDSEDLTDNDKDASHKYEIGFKYNDNFSKKNAESVETYKDIKDVKIKSLKEMTFDEIENNTLIISEVEKLVLLPVDKEQVSMLWSTEKDEGKYKSIDELYRSKYLLPLNLLNNNFSCKMKEVLELMKRSETLHFSKSKYLFKMLFKSNVQTPIIAACNNTYELDMYMNALKNNDLASFNVFNIEYIGSLKKK